MKFADIEVHTVAHKTSAQTNYVVKTPGGVLYCVFFTNNSVLMYSKSVDNGLTWLNPITINANSSGINLAVWYDRWSNISAGLIHIAYTNTTAQSTLYRTIDTENSDAFSTETTIFAGVSAAVSGSSLSITRAVGGNVYCRTCLDNGAEGGFFRLPNANVPAGAWDAARTINETLAGSDQMILVPDLNSADNQDIYGIFWDVSADEISRQNYDDSANTWAETSISTGMAEGSAATAFPHFAAAVDLTNSQTVLIAWNATDGANADLKCWTVTASSITAQTDVVANGTDDQGLAALSIDTGTGYWHAFYCGKSDGSETWNTDLNIYMKVSQDSGSTWGAETRITSDSDTHAVMTVFTAPRFTGRPAVAFEDDNSVHDILRVSVPVNLPRAQIMLGV